MTILLEHFGISLWLSMLPFKKYSVFDSFVCLISKGDELRTSEQITTACQKKEKYYKNNILLVIVLTIGHML